MAANRFYVVPQDATETEKVLRKKGYIELDPCVDRGDEFKIFIDTKKMQFWYVDDNCIAQCADIIREVHTEVYHLTTITDIKNGELG